MSTGQQIEAATDPGQADYGTIYITGIADTTKWSSHFKLYKVGARLPVLGNWSLHNDTLLFKPRFLPDPKVSYEVRNGEITFPLKFESIQTDTWSVQLWPDAQLIPANTLRIYLQFSQPMGLQNPHHYITLLDASGQIIPDAFVEVAEGLWNGDRTRLTLLFHPGRIKQSVGPNQVLGPVLKAGENYTIHVAEGMQSAEGVHLEEEFNFLIQTIDPIRSPIHTESWEITADSTEIAINTQRILDVALLDRMLALHRNDETIKGTWHSSGGQIRFKPEERLVPGKYSLNVSPQLEDISGNNTFAAFDQPSKVNLKGQAKWLSIIIK